MMTDAPCAVPAAAATRTRPASRALRRALPAVGILLGWQLLAVLEALATVVDAGRGGHAVALPVLLPTLMLQYLPLVVNSWVLALVFSRWPHIVLRRAWLVLVFLLSMMVFLPLLIGAGQLVELLRAGRPPADFPAMLAHAGRLGWWYNAFAVGLAFVAQALYAAWLRGRQQQAAAQRAQTEHLQLRLGLLQGQLKPHFLFNALNSISALVRTADPALADHALARLDELLDYALAVGKGKQPSVAEELRCLRVYFDLQSLRYGERMRLDWSVEERDWPRYPCPPLLFQPLAENAVHHGVEPHHQQCTIHIRLDYADGMVGLRMTNPVLAATRAGHGLGLSMTRERLDILYGRRATLNLDTDEHHYAIHLRFPVDGPAADGPDRR